MIEKYFKKEMNWKLKYISGGVYRMGYFLKL